MCHYQPTNVYYVISTRTDRQSPRACEIPNFNLNRARMSYKWTKVSFRSHSFLHSIIMSTSSSEESAGMAGHYATSSGFESTGSILFSLPSDSSDVQTEITPPISPTSFEGKLRTPRDILDASRRLGQISVLAVQGDSDVTPTKPPKQVHHRATSQSVANEEAGYEADGDGDGDGDGDEDGDEGVRAGAGTIATTRPIRRPGFLRIDTRQHRRVASMLATRRPTSPGIGFGDTDIPWLPPRAKLPSIHSSKPTTTGANALESYELRQRRGPRAEPVGLGIGFPENHPLRSRAVTMPVPSLTSPISDPHGVEEEEKMQEQARWSEWLPSGLPSRSKKNLKTAQVGAVYAPNPVRLVLRPTFLEVSPSPTEYLPARAGGAGTFCCDDVHDRLGLEIEQERRRALAREGRPVLDLY
ncbi:hypothetical protein OG21DRAFT_622166 [Imleria badia]|nr:hypothetical protein OG21DRAFT_622166 [Imleria badia]